MARIYCDRSKTPGDGNPDDPADRNPFPLLGLVETVSFLYCHLWSNGSRRNRADYENRTVSRSDAGRIHSIPIRYPDKTMVFTEGNFPWTNRKITLATDPDSFFPMGTVL
jgi:hypothetical protein